MIVSTFSNEDLTTTLNEAKDYIIDVWHHAGVITTEQKQTLHSYSIVAYSKGFWGKVFDKLRHISDKNEVRMRVVVDPISIKGEQKV